MTREYRIFGPPGTGKTTRLIHDIAQAASKHGSDRVMALSFTKAASVEIAEREVPLPKHMHGTLHSICWRALDRPTLAETKIADFNAAFPHMRLSGAAANVDEPTAETGGATRGDSHLGVYNLNRAKRVPRELWTESTLAFAAAWEDWKEQNLLWDFTDLLERALIDLPAAPGSPRVIFVDEAQDLSKLQFDLVRRWGERAEYFVLVGDDDQTIFSHSGADVLSLVKNDIPPENIRTLKQSHRLPKCIHALSQEWISKCSIRQSKEFLPRDAEGSIERIEADWRNPERIIDDIEARSDSCMILASCGYMLNEFLSIMRDRGIAFHNPYRRTRGDWNPISNSETSTINRIRMFLNCGDQLAPLWTMFQLNAWLDLIDAQGLLKRGAKTEIAGIAAERPAYRDPDWKRWFAHGDPFGFDPVHIGWLKDHAKASKLKTMEYPLKLLERGVADEKPRIIVGTIHSVKGGEASSVYLCPDMSPQGWNEWKAGAGHRDSVIRTMYVGMTRAKERLVLAKGAGPCSVRVG